VGAEVIIGGLVSAGIAYVWGWRRIRYLAAHWRAQTRRDEFERTFREVRETLTGESPFRAATADDAALVALLDAAKPDEDALAACGFTLLGDIVVQSTARPPSEVMRAFVDADHTTCAVLVATRKRPEVVRLLLQSYGDGATFATTRGPQASFAAPPFAHRNVLAADLPHAQLVAGHRAFAHAGDAAKSFVRIATRDDLLAAQVTARASIARWRLAQPPDELLDADLRAMLGEHYAKLGKIWARRMRDPLPEATVRRS